VTCSACGLCVSVLHKQSKIKGSECASLPPFVSGFSIITGRGAFLSQCTRPAHLYLEAINVVSNATPSPLSAFRETLKLFADIHVYMCASGPLFPAESNLYFWLLSLFLRNYILLKMAVFWVVPCSMVEAYQRFRGPCCLHHQGDRPVVAPCSAIALMMEAARTPETLVDFCQATRRYNPEDSHLRTHRRENLKSYLCTSGVGMSPVYHETSNTNTPFWR
jgi:hypothetical protein